MLQAISRNRVPETFEDYRSLYLRNNSEQKNGLPCTHSKGRALRSARMPNLNVATAARSWSGTRFALSGDPGAITKSVALECPLHCAIRRITSKTRTSCTCITSDLSVQELFSRKFLTSDLQSPLRAGTPPPTHNITLYVPICLSMLYSALQVLYISRRSQNQLGERWRSLHLSLMPIWGKFIVVPTLRILKPTIRDSRVAQKLSAQAREYVRAVRLGMLAAQSGFAGSSEPNPLELQRNERLNNVRTVSFHCYWNIQPYG